MSAHDNWLANYRHTVCEMWCENPNCDNHTSSITVDYEEEYGQGWTQPEECPICHARLTFDRPGPKILTEAADVTDEIVANVIDCLDWFQDEPGLNTEEFIDRLCKDYGDDDWDIESYHNAAVKKIMRIARSAKRETQL